MPSSLIVAAFMMLAVVSTAAGVWHVWTQVRAGQPPLRACLRDSRVHLLLALTILCGSLAVYLVDERYGAFPMVTPVGVIEPTSSAVDHRERDKITLRWIERESRGFSRKITYQPLVDCPTPGAICPPEYAALEANYRGLYAFFSNFMPQRLLPRPRARNDAEQNIRFISNEQPEDIAAALVTHFNRYSWTVKSGTSHGREWAESEDFDYLGTIERGHRWKQDRGVISDTDTLHPPRTAKHWSLLLYTTQPVKVSSYPGMPSILALTFTTLNGETEVVATVLQGFVFQACEAQPWIPRSSFDPDFPPW